ncbi:MAG: DUF421 domain-containing protein [Bacillota bacterium]|uniref:Uncharacterized membrane protein YcaP, DUF421 family n=2 Tax=Carboxydocella TaxID=178898 RepID=A0A1T4N8F7_9FIRM|nr:MULTISPECIES: DUF421 domain-containing protein [Carboxydocella]AVX20947.1 Uncharacterized membrane protein YcaP, DUF421 family [Carboxydocella thermautotrophica]AVX31361.1 Uncharacterized membrane protein YcaP, DUF421 family [Carboxydocella thermautotrophica]SJZ75580.1 Uncharacterized membrane protein YcaP, DUF421 family [Carboxydocella sporoproducens DSM 16521]GAW29890.1 DUF421 domain-containing protein [Carboxydocella sp. ULO1]GAW32515.1 DUF421 domain-containing protein [Carboxydocella sp
MANVVLRAIFVYIFILVMVRLMGKREVGQLSTFDIVVFIVLAELAAIPMEYYQKPLLPSLVPILVVVLLEIITSYLALKFPVFRKLMDGQPSIVVANGQPVIEEMKRLRYSLDDLMAQLREKGFTSPAEVEFAVLETSGKLSVIPKSQNRPVTPADLSLATSYEGLPIPLIKDGIVQKHNLGQIGLSENWLVGELQKQGYQQPQQIFFALLDTRGQLHLYPR